MIEYLIFIVLFLFYIYAPFMRSVFAFLGLVTESLSATKVGLLVGSAAQVADSGALGYFAQQVTKPILRLFVI